MTIVVDDNEAIASTSQQQQQQQHQTQQLLAGGSLQNGGLPVGVCTQQGKRPYQEDEYAVISLSHKMIIITRIF